MAAKKRKCATPKCRGNALNTERWCFACRRVLLKNMRESGYFTDTSWIDREEAEARRTVKESAIEANARDNDTRRHKERTRHGSGHRQLSGAMLPSGNKKGKK